MNKFGISSNKYITNKNAVILIIVIHVLITLFLSYKLNISEDEAYALNTSSKGIKYAFSQSINFENQPPLYFLLLTLWRKINDSIIFARIFSVLCSVFTLFFFNKIIIEKISQTKSYIYLSIFAFNPYLIDPSSEIRTNSIVILFSVLSHYLFIQYLKERNFRNTVLFYIVSILGLYTHYFLIFIPLSQFIFILLKSIKRKKFDFRLIDLSFIAMSLLFLIISFIGDQMVNQSSAFKEYDFLTFQSILIKSIVKYIFPLSHYHIIQLILFVIFIMIFSIGYKTVLRKNYEDFKSNSFFQYQLLCILVPLVVLSLINICFPTIKMGQHHFNTIFSSLIIVLIYNLNYFYTKNQILLIILLEINLIFAVVNFNRHYIRAYDYRGISQYLYSFNKTNEPILVYRNNHIVPLRYYYSGKGEMMPIPKGISFDKYYLKGFKNSKEIDSILTVFLKDKSEFWLINDTISQAFNTAFLQKEFNSNINLKCNTINDTMITGISIRHLERK